MWKLIRTTPLPLANGELRAALGRALFQSHDAALEFAE
jgi:hypothetical protein